MLARAPGASCRWLLVSLSLVALVAARTPPSARPLAAVQFDDLLQDLDEPPSRGSRRRRAERDVDLDELMFDDAEASVTNPTPPPPYKRLPTAPPTPSPPPPSPPPTRSAKPAPAVTATVTTLAPKPAVHPAPAASSSGVVVAAGPRQAFRLPSFLGIFAVLGRVGDLRALASGGLVSAVTLVAAKLHLRTRKHIRDIELNNSLYIEELEQKLLALDSERTRLQGLAKKRIQLARHKQVEEAKQQISQLKAANKALQSDLAKAQQAAQRNPVHSSRVTELEADIRQLAAKLEAALKEKDQLRLSLRELRDAADDASERLERQAIEAAEHARAVGRAEMEAELEALQLQHTKAIARLTDDHHAELERLHSVMSKALANTRTQLSARRGKPNNAAPVPGKRRY